MLNLEMSEIEFKRLQLILELVLDKKNISFTTHIEKDIYFGEMIANLHKKIVKILNHSNMKKDA